VKPTAEDAEEAEEKGKPMRLFTDTDKREWQISITGATIKRARDLLSIDMGDPNTGVPPLWQRVHTDLVLLVDMLFVVCRPQAVERNISDEAFAGLLGGEALAAAKKAMLDEWSDFFRLFGRPALGLLISKASSVVDRAMEIANDKLGSPALAQLMERAIQEASNDSTPTT
jgi:hypothetical protein